MGRPPRRVAADIPVICSGDNTWLAQVDASELADGVVTIAASTEDGVGNPSEVREQQVIKDTEIPRLKFNHHNNIFGTETDYQLSGYCSEAGEDMEVTFLGGGASKIRKTDQLWG